MRGRQGWVVASVLLILGACAGAGAVHQHWLPCRGSMLSGSVLRGYAYGPDFGDACLKAMDNGFAFVWPTATQPVGGVESVLGVVCALLLALAWGVVVLTSGWSRATRLAAALPAVLTAAAGLVSLLEVSSDTLDRAYFWLLVAVSLSAVVAFVVVAVREEPGRRTLTSVALVLLASTTVGFFPLCADYAFMASVSDASWDNPPGSGYPTVVAVALLAVSVLVVTLRPVRPAPVGARTDLVDA